MSVFLGYCLVAAVCADSPVAQAAEREKGKILILENQRVIEGDIDRLGDKYRVRRGSGELLIPATPAMRLCESWEDAYEFMRSRANLGDPDERLRLARWCQLNGLRVQALAEVTAAIDMRPDYPEAKQLQALLTRPTTDATPVSLTKTGVRPKNVSLGPDLNAESLAFYATKVQPILFNACAHCHTAGRGGAFQIHRSNEPGGQRPALQKTLGSIIDQIDMGSPGLSPLLVKAASAHFPSGPPPLAGKQSKAFQTLERWVTTLPELNPHLRGGSLTSVSELIPTSPKTSVLKKGPPAPPANSRQLTPPESVKPAPKTPEAAPPSEAPTKTTQVSVPEFVSASLPAPAKVAPLPPPAALPSDPFDPIIFNRHMHPNR